MKPHSNPARQNAIGPAISSPALKHRALPRWVRATIGACALMAGLALGQSAASAANFVVTSTADSGAETG